MIPRVAAATFPTLVNFMDKRPTNKSMSQTIKYPHAKRGYDRTFGGASSTLTGPHTARKSG
jgi:hypothetical protein